MPPLVNSYAAWSMKLARPWMEPTFTMEPPLICSTNADTAAAHPHR